MADIGRKIVYKLDNGVPQNPFGRTGLRGRGSLLRWGPNHYLMVVITRYSSDSLQVVIEIDKNNVCPKPKPKCSISLLNRFIPGELTYVEIESLFITETHRKGWKLWMDWKVWTHSNKMIQFFKRCNISDESPETTTDTTVSQLGLKYEIIRKGYCDESLNTDHDWKEVEFIISIISIIISLHSIIARDFWFNFILK